MNAAEQIETAKPISRYTGDLRDGWPAEIPYITRTEAKRAETRLYKKFGRLDNGRKKTRYSFRFRGKAWVCLSGDPGTRDRGWRCLVHDISHDLHHWRYPRKTPHGSFHAAIERELIDYVVNKTSWLQGGLRPKTKAKPTIMDRREQRLAAARDMVAKWERKHKLATTKLKLYRADVHRLERVAAQPIPEPKPAKPRKPSVQRLTERRARLQARDLAEHFGVHLDHFDGLNVPPNMVYPPDRLYPDETLDPYHDEHSSEHTWIDTWERVVVYVEAVLAAEAKTP